MRSFRSKCKRLLFAALCIALALDVCGCGGRGGTGDGGNMPYEPDTPAPAPHSGVFRSHHGTMTFNGDGRSVTIDFDADLAQRLGLPAGEQAATYEFRSGDLPPHGFIPVRYDVAMTFFLTVGEGENTVTVMTEAGQYADGDFYTGTNCITADRITLFVDKGDGSGDWEPVEFQKS